MESDRIVIFDKHVMPTKMTVHLLKYLFGELINQPNEKAYVIHDDGNATAFSLKEIAEALARLSLFEVFRIKILRKHGDSIS